MGKWTKMEKIQEYKAATDVVRIIAKGDTESVFEGYSGTTGVVLDSVQFRTFDYDKMIFLTRHMAKVLNTQFSGYMTNVVSSMEAEIKSLIREAENELKEQIDELKKVTP